MIVGTILLPMLAAIPSATVALADTGGSSVTGMGVQCSRDTMGMSSNTPMSTHHGYRLDYRTVSGLQSGNLAPRLSMVTFDAGTNQTIPSTSYLVTIERVNQTVPANATNGGHPQFAVVDTVVTSNVFLTVNGNLTLKLRSSPSAQPDSQPVIHATQDPIQNAWLTDPDNTITIDNLRMVPGTYHAQVELFGADTPQCLFSGSDTPKYDIYWNIDANGSVTALGSSVVPEFGISQLVLALSFSGIVGAVVFLRKRFLAN